MAGTLKRVLKKISLVDAGTLLMSLTTMVVGAIQYSSYCESEIKAMDPAVEDSNLFTSKSVALLTMMLNSAYCLHLGLRNLGASSRVLWWSVAPFLGSFAVLVCLHVRKLVLVTLSSQCYAEQGVLGQDTIATVVCPNFFTSSSDDLKIFYDAPKNYVYQLIYIAEFQAICIFLFFYLRIGDHIGRTLAEEEFRQYETSDQTSEKAPSSVVEL